ncbi:hypothetical protein [Psychrobacillus sp. FJAT-21963]|uniref:hypothetical protein n=1 Tax=Psychrobacillus sp. FJAT-21963 TaxID=1712028 RepID=UPI0006F434E4|nr:hypothetical protein [Psychrobacillus sp. FJAT-21963]KQL34410.1 hypothetical protein AN959_15545 [Psychrobacillus sp. FJAT-21963]
MSNIPTKIDFIKAIEKAKKNAVERGESNLELQAKDLHKELGYYPGPNHRMKTCCGSMYDSMNTSNGDEVVSAPESGYGASLIIRYNL